MAGLVVSFVFLCVASGSLKASVHRIENPETQLITDVLDTDLNKEANTGYDASSDNFGGVERFERSAEPDQVGQHTRLNYSEVHVQRSGNQVYWKDNAETQRLRQGEATITRVIHHGIYPSLNVTEPIVRSNWTSRFIKSRTKRDGLGGISPTRTDYRYESQGGTSASGAFHRETSIQGKYGPRTVYNGRNKQNGSVYTTYKAQYHPNNTNNRRYNSVNYNNAIPSKPKFDRFKRNLGGHVYPSYSSSSYDSNSLNGSVYREASAQGRNRSEPAYNWRENFNGTVKTTYQAHYPPYNSSSNRNSGSVGSSSYARAVHPVNGSRDYSFYTHQFQQPLTNRSNSTTKYRTLYYPAGDSLENSRGYKGNVGNKGNVRLISVGYYSVNESRDGVRSYYNPPGRNSVGLRESPSTNGFVPSRHKRATWDWVDRLLVVFGINKLKEEPNEAPEGSETIKLEVADGGNDVLQNHYGYSTNGHQHVVPAGVDRIYLVGATTSNPTTVPTTDSAQIDTVQVTSPETSYDWISDSSEELQPVLPEPEQIEQAEPTMQSMLPTPSALLPHTGTVLIQAPPRKNYCRPPKRLARGQCRTVW